MDQAKAIVNLKEGIIQLEGPVEFVREYLNIYGSAIKGLEEIPKETEAAPKEKTVRGKAKTTRVKAAAKRVSCADAVRAEVEAGFFAEPRSARETNEQLIGKGMTYTVESTRMALNMLCGKGVVDRVKEGGRVRYRGKV